MRRLRNYLIGIVLEALKRRDELIDAELANLRGMGGEENAARYTALRDGRYW